jgi:hypothetical protein
LEDPQGVKPEMSALVGLILDMDIIIAIVLIVKPFVAFIKLLCVIFVDLALN